jgi:hypothetical protein
VAGKKVNFPDPSKSYKPERLLLAHPAAASCARITAFNGAALPEVVCLCAGDKATEGTDSAMSIV